MARGHDRGKLTRDIDGSGKENNSLKPDNADDCKARKIVVNVYPDIQVRGPDRLQDADAKHQHDAELLSPRELQELDLPQW